MDSAGSSSHTATPGQLQLAIHDEEEGLPPLRLQEPIASLQLTPFAAKAARSIEASTVGELADTVFDASKECRSLGQGHLDEIRRKIEQFVGTPPYPHERHLDLPSLLRLSLCDVEASERAGIVVRCGLQPLVLLSPQEIREAEVAIAIDKQQKWFQILEKARQQGADRLHSLVDRLFHGLVRPWVSKRGGLAHEEEIMRFLFDAQGQGADRCDYGLFEKAIRLLLLLANADFLFERPLFPIARRLWALTPNDQTRARTMLQDADILMDTLKGGSNLRALARAVEECRFEQWDACTCATIERLLFWYYREQ